MPSRYEPGRIPGARTPGVPSFCSVSSGAPKYSMFGGFRVIPPGGRCDLSPDGTRLAILAVDALWVLNLDDGSVRKVETDWPGSPLSVSWSGDATWLCVTGQAGEATSWLRRVNLDGTSKLLWGSEGGGFLPLTRPAPDGSSIAVAFVQGENDVWMLEDF